MKRASEERGAEITFTPNAMEVLRQRYLLKDGEGRPLEKPEAMFRRVAENVAETERLFPRNFPQRNKLGC